MNVRKRVRCHFKGIVQGVGFRPSVYRLAIKYGLDGFAQNRSDGVIVEVEGAQEAVDAFINDFRTNLPPLASVSEFSQREIPVANERRDFRIMESIDNAKADVHIPPDIAVCDDCLKELFDSDDRRYKYPFINCTNCGPRLTIIKAIPYDRINTSMSCFPMCPDCRREYEDPLDRRFHAQPNACPVCGPSLKFLDAQGNLSAVSDPVRSVVDALLDGAIVAIKGLGGYHLSVDAQNDEALRRLRRLKLREEKPFAIMVKDIEQASRLARLSDIEKALLKYIERPVVLVVKGNKDMVAPSVAPGLRDLGIMLPYTPLHHLLFAENFQALVMTSANRTDEPICIRNREALTRLSGIADYFLVHNRDILVRCDDSVATVRAGWPQLVRRARGFAPKPVALKGDYPEVLALGAHLKATVCIIKKNHAFLSPHIGDMETPLARDFFHENIILMKHITQCNPSVVACDLHPGYYSSMAAGALGASEVIAVQHHHAHIASCMAENGLSGDVIGLAMDGVGYGPDGQVWGGEVLVANEMDFRRAGHINYFLLPGGEKAIHEPWRTAAGLLRLSYGNDWQDAAKSLNIITDYQLLDMMEKIMISRINSPHASSLGRLFDGVASIIGLRREVRFEGQAAMELEALASHAESPCLPYTIQEDKEQLILDFAPTIKAIVEGKLAGQSPEALASAFHITLVEAFTKLADTVRQESGLTRVVLSGGCFQNRFLLEGCVSSLTKAEFEVFTHQLIPTNDGGISLGQAVIAGSRIKSKRKIC